MKIVVLEGSPNRNGSTHILADCFRQGAEEAGHTVELIDVAHADIHPCTGCIHCGYEGPCVQKDDVEGIRRKILDADMLVFVTPPVLLRDVRSVKGSRRPVLRLQQFHSGQTHEVRPDRRRLEQRRLDL